MWKRSFVLLCIAAFLSACSSGHDAGESTVQTFSTQEAQSEETETESQEDVMNREFCTVEKIENDYFVIKNTRGEIYHIDSTFLNDFKVGDNVLLIYTTRTSEGDEFYNAEVQSVNHFNTRIAPSYY